MTKNDITRLERVAWEAVRAGERELLRLFQKSEPSDFSYKKNREIITTSDLASNDAIIRVLRRETPSFDILSEESAPRQKSNCTWILDPLDGTTNFAAQLPLWGISLALVCDAEIELGVISLPLMREQYLAIKDKGAWRINGKKRTRLHTSTTQIAEDALGLVCAGYGKEETRRGETASNALALASRSSRRLGAAVIETTWVANGRADYALLQGIHPWDVAAGALLVKEAGGNVTTPNGRPWKLGDPDVLFSSPGLTKKIVRIIARVD